MRLYIKQDMHVYSSHGCASVCVSVLSLLALTCAKIHWSPTGGSLIFCRLPEGTGKRGADGVRQVGKGGVKEGGGAGALTEVALWLSQS